MTIDLKALSKADLSKLPPKARRKIEDELRAIEIAEERETCEDQLLYFLEKAWPYIDNSEFISCWAIEAMCDHLEAVTLGHIKRLLINIPPRCCKTTLCSVVFPAWTWARRKRSYLSGPQVKFLCASYGHGLSLMASNQSRRLLQSSWFQSRWPNQIEFRIDQNAKHNYENSEGGARVATSVGGGLIGLGGDVLIADDLNNTADVESEAERETVKEFWKEFHSTRLNNPKESAIIAIQQRLDVNDVSGLILDAVERDEEDWVHLCIPMRYDPSRSYVTVVLPQYEDKEPYDDPRTDENELMWEERFDDKAVTGLERTLGPYMAAGRLQQLPFPKGGGIIQDIWWQNWTPEARLYGLTWDPGINKLKEFPQMELVVASVDTAMKEKEENDFSAMTVWGIWLDRARNRRAMLMYAWDEHLALHGKRPLQDPGEPDVVYRVRVEKAFGLCEKVAQVCKRYRVQRLLIEDKTRGHDLAAEIKRLYAHENWGVEMVEPQRDKVTRTHSIVPMFTDGAVWAPETKWADKVIKQCAQFPKGANDDLHDTVTQFLKWARDNEILVLIQDEEMMRLEDASYKGPQKSVANLYGLQ